MTGTEVVTQRLTGMQGTIVDLLDMRDTTRMMPTEIQGTTGVTTPGIQGLGIKGMGEYPEELATSVNPMAGVNHIPEIQGMIPELIQESSHVLRGTQLLNNELNPQVTDLLLTMGDTNGTAERRNTLSTDTNVSPIKKISWTKKLKRKKREERDYNFMCLSCVA